MSKSELTGTVHMGLNVFKGFKHAISSRATCVLVYATGAGENETTENYTRDRFFLVITQLFQVL